MNYFTHKDNRKMSLLILLIFNILSIVISIAGIFNLKITKGTAGIAFTGNLLLAVFTIFFSLSMTIYSIVLYLKQSENPVLIDKEKGMIFSN
jgi:hypothetical protein